MASRVHNLERVMGILKYIQKIKGLPAKIDQCIKEERCDHEIFAQL